MEAIAIETEAKEAELLERLTFEYGSLSASCCPVSIETFRRPGQTAYVCVLEEAAAHCGGDKDWFTRCTANAISDVLVNEWEPIMLRRLLESHYQYFSPSEKEAICAAAQQHLASGTGSTEDTQAYKVRQKENVMGILLDFLRTTGRVNIGGFAVFRLPEYRKALLEAIDAAVDEFFLDREYAEFIHLLRYFVSIQEPKAEEVHIVFASDGVFQMLDEEQDLIEYDSGEEGGGAGGSEVSYEDLLLSALVTIAPQRIILHAAPGDERQEIAATISDVFGARVAFCHGCSICHPAPEEKIADRTEQNKWKT